MSTNPLLELEGRYRDGQLTKGAYIEEMYGLHMGLFQYGEFLKSRNVERITITDAEVQVTARNGVTLVANPGDQRIIPIEILNFGDFEQAETDLMLGFVQSDSVVVDIGANVGWYSVLLGRQASRGRVIAFEPIPSTIEFLKRNLALNGTSNVELYEHGLSEREEELVFFFQPHLSGATSARNLLDNAAAVEVRASVKRLDDVVLHEPRIDLLKCDIEGAELFALRGAVGTIARTKPVLFIEMLRKWSAKFGYHPNDIIGLLAPLGYRCFAVLEGGKLSAIEGVTEETVATNFIFLHGEKHAGWELRYR